MAMTPDDVLKMIKDKEVKFVDIRFTDTRGKEQHVSVPAKQFTKDKFTDGHAFDGSSIAGWKGIQASDMLLMPDPTSAYIDPFMDETTLNINADTFASALAARMKAKRLLLLTDVAGVLDKEGRLIERLSIDQARRLIRDGIVTGGMIPKIEGCIEVVEAGVEAVVVLDGRVPHCVLLELFTEHGVGTLVARKAKKA